MSMPRSSSYSDTDTRTVALAGAIAACRRATAPSRALDAQIALAVFPSLIELQDADTGIWIQADGTRVRALRYSEARSAAATLVPPGFWIEETGASTAVLGPDGTWADGHRDHVIALCIAALSARLAGAARDH